MADFADVLARELEELLEAETVPEEVAGDIEELADYFGDTPREQNPAMAAALAGTSDKGSRAYKAAIRSVQRYRASEGKQRRTASPGRLRIIFDVRRTIAALVARITGDIQVSSDRRHRTCPVGPAVTLDAGDTIAAHEAGDAAGAADAFLAAFADAYGVAIEVLDCDTLELGAGR